MGAEIAAPLAKTFVDGGYARIVEKKAPAAAPVPVPEPIETAMAEPTAEKAVLPEPTKRKAPSKRK